MSGHGQAIKSRPGSEAVQVKGWFVAHKWLLLRRISQVFILGLFLAGPWFGVWLVKGNLSASLTLDTMPLTDILAMAQMLMAGHWPEAQAYYGVLIVIGFYLLVGGRVFCSWACPLNPVTDLAAWLRGVLRIRHDAAIRRTVRYWILVMTLILPAATGLMVWEWVNPVSLLHRGLFFGMGLAWVAVAAVFLFDLFVSRHGWCGRLCPMGAAYGLLTVAPLLRVRAEKREACNDCMDCYLVCPEPKVITPALKGSGDDRTRIILSQHCTNCGRCIDVCSKDVFRLAIHSPQKTRVTL